MGHEDLLIGIAEVSIALTGFAGIVAVFGRRTTGPWPLADQYLLRSLIENGLLVVLAALLPFAVLQHTQDPTVVWRVSSGPLAGLRSRMCSSFKAVARFECAVTLMSPFGIWFPLPGPSS